MLRTMSEVYALVRQLRGQPRPSRNRHFEELSQPLAMRARKLVRRLDTLERELKSSARVSVRRCSGGVAVKLEHPAVRLERTAYLTIEEHALLSADPALAAVLAVD
jgi:hypothetical protein